LVRAFAHVGATLVFKGQGVNETGIIDSVNSTIEGNCLKAGDEVLAIDPRYFRPTEVDLLLGDPTKSKTVLGWKPKYDVNALLREMVDADLDLMRGENVLKQGGFRVYNFHE
jgi:GDPmannose 4,6-dehydratase